MTVTSLVRSVMVFLAYLAIFFYMHLFFSLGSDTDTFYYVIISAGLLFSSISFVLVFFRRPYIRVLFNLLALFMAVTLVFRAGTARERKEESRKKRNLLMNEKYKNEGRAVARCTSGHQILLWKSKIKSTDWIVAIPSDFTQSSVFIFSGEAGLKASALESLSKFKSDFSTDCKFTDKDAEKDFLKSLN